MLHYYWACWRLKVTLKYVIHFQTKNKNISLYVQFVKATDLQILNIQK